MLVFFITLAVCAGLTAGLVYRYDLYEHEPIWLLAVAVALGAVAMGSAGHLEARILHGMPRADVLDVAAIAALAEETLKLAVVVVVALLARREFDDPMDGVVYGAMAGLGAAVEESVFYSGLSPARPTFVPAAELVRLWAHVVLGGIVGFPVGFWRAAPARAAAFGAVGLAVAWALHFAWDALVLSLPAGAAPRGFQTFAGIALMLASLALFGKLVAVASARSRQEFAPGSRRGLWGWPFKASR